MSTLNPYDVHIGGRPPMEVIGETPGRLRALFVKLGGKAGKAPAPGKWSAREILCHLADTEIAFALRLRQALAEPHHVIQPFDQEKWAAFYGAYDVESALEMFSALRGWSMRLLGTVPADAMSRPVTHPERGEMTFRTLVETMAGHDLNHLKQIEAIAA